MQTLHSTEVLYGTMPPQGTVDPDPGEQFGHFKQVTLPSDDSTASWSSWQTCAEKAWLTCKKI